jgi:hypothetical protein
MSNVAWHSDIQYTIKTYPFHRFDDRIKATVNTLQTRDTVVLTKSSTATATARTMAVDAAERERFQTIRAVSSPWDLFEALSFAPASTEWKNKKTRV